MTGAFGVDACGWRALAAPMCTGVLQWALPCGVS